MDLILIFDWDGQADQNLRVANIQF